MLRVVNALLFGVAIFALAFSLLSDSAKANDVTVAYVQQNNNGNLVIATGNQLIYTVVNINPILYDHILIQETYTTQPAPAPTLPTTLSGTLGTQTVQAEQQQSIESLGAKLPTNTSQPDCSTPSSCLQWVNFLQAPDNGLQALLTQQVDLWNDYVTSLQQSIVQAINDYNGQQLAQAASGPLTPIDLSLLPNNDLACMMEVQQDAAALPLANAGKFPGAGSTSNCLGRRTIPSLYPLALFAAVTQYELMLNQLRNQIAVNLPAFSASSNPGAVQTGINDAPTLLGRLGTGTAAVPGLDLSSWTQEGTSGLKLSQQLSALLPFADLDLTHKSAPSTLPSQQYLTASWSSLTIPCAPYRFDGTNTAVVITATSRISTGSAFSTAVPNVPSAGFPNLARQISTVQCPGAFAVSAGIGETTLPQNSYPVVQPNPNASPPAGNVVPTSATHQAYAGAFAHYQLIPFGNSKAGLFATVGVGSSTTSFSGFYGLSIGFNRFFFVNVLMNYGNISVPVAGAVISGSVPATYTVPTMNSATSRLSIGISFGAALPTAPATPGTPASTGP